MRLHFELVDGRDNVLNCVRLFGQTATSAEDSLEAKAALLERGRSGRRGTAVPHADSVDHIVAGGVAMNIVIVMCGTVVVQIFPISHATTTVVVVRIGAGEGEEHSQG